MVVDPLKKIGLLTATKAHQTTCKKFLCIEKAMVLLCFLLKVL